MGNRVIADFGCVRKVKKGKLDHQVVKPGVSRKVRQIRGTSDFFWQTA